MKEDYLLFWTFAYCSIYSAIFPSIIGLYSFKTLSPSIRIVSLFVMASFILDNIALYFPIYANEVNNGFRLIEFICLLILYRSIFQKSKNEGVYASLGLGYLIFFLIELLLNTQKQLNSYSITLTSLVFIVFSVRYFYLLIRDLPTDRIQRLPMFWVNTGVLTYFAGGLFLFAMRNYLISAFQDDQTIYWTFHNFLNIVKNLLFAVALWQDLRKPKPI